MKILCLINKKFLLVISYCCIGVYFCYFFLSIRLRGFSGKECKVIYMGWFVLSIVGVLYSFVCFDFYFDLIYFREIKVILKICYYFFNKFKVYFLGFFYYYVIRERVFNYLVNLER